MLVSGAHFLFMLTLAMIAMRTITMHVIRKYPGSSIAQAMSYTYG